MRPHERQRPSVPSRTSTARRRTTRCGRGLLELRGPLDRDSADAGVLQREPAQDGGDAARLLRLLERGVAQPSRVEQELQQRPLCPIAGDGEREHAEKLGAVRVDRRVDELPRVLEAEAAPSLAQVTLDDREPAADRAAATRPRASSRAPTGALRRGARPRARRRGRVGRRRRGRRAAARSVPRRRCGSRGAPPGARRAARAPTRRARDRRSPTGRRRARRRGRARRARSGRRARRSARAPTAGGRAATRRRTSSSRRRAASRREG